MKQRTQVIVLIVLMVIAAAIFGAQYWPSNGAKSSGTALLTIYQHLDYPKPEIQWDRIELRRKTDYKPSGVNLFSLANPPSAQEVKAQQEQAAAVAKVAQETAAIAPLPDPTLPADMKFFGYGNVPNGTPRRAFLSYQDDVYIVSEGDTLIGRFRILKINNSMLEFEELSSGRRGQKVMEDQGPSA